MVMGFSFCKTFVEQQDEQTQIEHKKEATRFLKRTRRDDNVEINAHNECCLQGCTLSEVAEYAC